MSILPFYFPSSSSSSSPTLLFHSLVVSLHLPSSLNYWLIRISGEMSECPAYLGVTITDLSQYDELFRYDLLVLCPSTFNVSFRFPSSLRRTTQSLMTSSFDVYLSDAVRSHHVYLTFVDLRRPSYDADDDDDGRSGAIVFDRRVSASTSSSLDHTLLFYVVAVIIVVLALLSAFIHADRHVRLGRWVALTPVPALAESRPSPSRTLCTYHWCGNGHVGCPAAVHQTASSPFFNDAKYRCYCRSADGRTHHVVSTHRYRLLVCAYVTLLAVTGLLATFNLFFYVVGVLVDGDLRHVAAMTGDGQADTARVRRTAEANLSLMIDAHRRDELRRYRDGVVERVHACRSHVDNTVHRTAATVANESTQVADIGWSVIVHRTAGTLANESTQLADIGWTVTVHRTAGTLANESTQVADIGWSVTVHRTAGTLANESTQVADIGWSVIVHRTAATLANESTQVADIGWTVTVHRTAATLANESTQLADIGWTVTAVTAEQYAGKLAAYDARVDAFTTAFQTKLTAAIGRTMRRYGAYVNSLMNAVWLRFAVDVFNSTHRASPPSHHADYYGLGSQALAEFGSFLEVDEVKQVEVWVSRFWQRYERLLPQHPDVPLDVDSSSSNPCGRQFNLTGLHYLDSSRFIVSLSHIYDYSAASDRQSSRRTFRSLRRKTNKAKVKSRASSSTDAAVVDLNCFRLIFVAVDVAIIAFHICRGYVDLQRLQRCRCRCQEARIDPCALRNGGLPMATDPGDDRVGLGRLLPPPPPSDGLLPGMCNDATTATKTSTTTNDCVALHEPESDAPTCHQCSTDVVQQRRRQSYVVARTTMILVGRIVRSRSLLPLLACAFVLAATHCVVRTCSRLSASHPPQSGGTLASVLATSVRFQAAAANAHLSEDMRHLDSAVLQLSSNSMSQDLHNLLNIVHYFRQEQRRMIDTFVSDACDARRLQQTNMTSCDDVNNSGARDSLPQIPVIVPCSFVPLSPRLLDDRLERRFEQQLVGSVQSFIDASRRVVTTASYVILVAIVTWFGLRVAAMLVSRRLAAIATPLRHSAELDERADNDVSDDDDDNDDVICRCDVTERHDDAPLPPPLNAHQSGIILHSLKYYETNV